MTEERDAIFIHSLWRSGSTYFFESFRRSPPGYFAYQEPVHETMLAAATNRKLLLAVSSEVSGTLRHPELSAPYYAEADQTYDHWREKIRKSFIYDGYFARPLDDDLRHFLAALIDAAPRKAVIQECRTSCRIAAIKEGLGGRHIYIWRNPRDQWWSLKINVYFDVVMQMILNADPHPPAVAAFRARIGFTPFHAGTIPEELAYFCLKPLSARNSYAAFFLIWSLGWIEAHGHADIVVNLDTLSTSKSYRDQTKRAFAAKAIDAPSFDDCRMPCAPFAKGELEFFDRIEGEVYQLLADNGVPAASLADLQEAQCRGMPAAQRIPPAKPDVGAAMEALKRIRALFIRLQDEHAALASGHEIALDQAAAQGAAREQELASQLESTSIQMQQQLLHTQKAASVQFAAKDALLADQIVLHAEKERERRAQERMWQETTTALMSERRALEAQLTALRTQREELESRASRIEAALSAELDQARADAEEAAGLWSSRIMRLLAWLKLVRPPAIRQVPRDAAESVSAHGERSSATTANDNCAAPAP